MAVPQTVTIASGQSLSDAAYIGSSCPVCVEIPAWDNAVLTFQGSMDTDLQTFRDIFTANGELFVAASTGNKIVALNPEDFIGVVRIKLRSGTSSVPVTQSAQRQLKFFTRTIS